MRIPLPGNNGEAFLKGLDSGSSMWSRIMQPIIAREKEKQQGEQFNLSKKQQAEQFEKELALRKQAEARMGANTGLNRQILQQQLLGLQHKNDPMYEFNQFKALQDMVMGSGKPQQNQPVQQQPTEPLPTQQMGEGMGMFSPEGLGQAQTENPVNQQPPQQPESVQGINLDALRKNPMLRGYFKSKFGYDPLGGESNVLHGPARDAADLEKLRKEVGEESDVYKNAKTQYEAQIDAKKDLRDLRARTKQGLKPGEKEFFDTESGEPLGKEIPLTAAERQSEEGNILFNELYPYVYNGASPFSGEGSITRLEQAVSNYKSDPNARKLVDDYLLAEKMLGATTVNEASTLKAGRTNRTYGMLKDTLESQDIPKIAKKLFKQYGLPASAQLQASMRYQEILSDARKKARKSTPATQKLFYNPELQEKNEEQKLEGNTETSGTVRMSKNGEFYDIPSDKVSLAETKGYKRG